MPLLCTIGGASVFGLRRGGATAPGASFITATGGTITTDGDYKYHTFTADGTFEVTSSPTDAVFDYLIVAGGGSCGNQGAGGAGGVIIRTSEHPSTGTYAVVIGAGGVNANGGDSTFHGKTAIGGGKGGVMSWPYTGYDGGSGGGGDYQPGVGARPGGAALQPSSSDGGYGNNGGSGSSGGSGGGAGGAGGSGLSGGAGISGSPLSSSTYGEGGGRNADSDRVVPNSGNGGWSVQGGGTASWGYGSSGIVIVRYQFQ